MRVPVVWSIEVRRYVLDSNPEPRQLNRPIIVWYTCSSADDIRLAAVHAIGKEDEVPQGRYSAAVGYVMNELMVKPVPLGEGEEPLRQRHGVRWWCLKMATRRMSSAVQQLLWDTVY